MGNNAVIKGISYYHPEKAVGNEYYIVHFKNKGENIEGVTSDQLRRYVGYNEAIAYANFADSACAMMIENIFHTDRGFVDEEFYTNSNNLDKILMPAKGMSSVTGDRNLPMRGKLVQYGKFNFDGAFYSEKISIEEII